MIFNLLHNLLKKYILEQVIIFALFLEIQSSQFHKPRYKYLHPNNAFKWVKIYSQLLLTHCILTLLPFNYYGSKPKTPIALYNINPSSTYLSNIVIFACN